MEKNSEKLIRANSPVDNRFKGLLSQVQIVAPKQGEAKKKQKNLALEVDSYIDRKSSKLIQEDTLLKVLIKQKEALLNRQQKQNHNAICVPQKTKSSSILKQLTLTQKLLHLKKISQSFSKHYADNSKLRESQLLNYSFGIIKIHSNSQNYTFHKTQSMQQFEKVLQLAAILNRMQYLRVRSFFDKIVTLYRDSLLFGLSNTVGDVKDNSLLKFESQCGNLGLETAKQLKRQGNVTDKQIPLGIMTKKPSQSAASQSLSGLILNHNKLNIAAEGNQVFPNIPKSNRNISNKLIDSNKDIGELSLQTKKKIETSKKQIQNNDLPLESKKRLKDNNQQLTQQSTIKDQEQKPGHCPITFTYVLKNLDCNQLMPNNSSNDILQSKKQLEDQIMKFKASNEAPIVQSHYHQPIKNFVLEPTKQQKRSISLQIKHFPGICISSEKPNHQINLYNKYNNQYYNQYNCNRQNLRRLNFQNIGSNQAKARPQSAAPKITFNFCSSNQQVLASQKNNINVQKVQIKSKYEQMDCIIQKSLPNDKNSHLAKLSTQRQGKPGKNNRLQVISPSHRRQEKNANQKLKTEQRIHIKQKLLPPPIENQYYNNEPNRNMQQRQKNLPMLASSNGSTSPSAQINHIRKNQLKQFKKSLINELYFGERQGQEAGCVPALCKKSEQNLQKVKCHKEKILVTYPNKERI